MALPNSLYGTFPQNDYGTLIHFSISLGGVASTLNPIYDGSGNPLPIQISGTQVQLGSTVFGGSAITFAETTTPSSPPAPSNVMIYAKSDDSLYSLNSSGIETQITSTGGFVPGSRTISTTSPLTGGGDLTANRTLGINQSLLSIANTQITGVTLTTGASLSGSNTGDQNLSAYALTSNVFAIANNLSEGNASTMRTNLGLGTLATQSGTFSGTSSGTNTGDQTITLTGNVTGSGSGSFATTIASNAVNYAKMQQASAHTLLGNPTSSTANVSEITLGSGLSFSGTTIVASGSGSITSGSSENGTSAIFDSASSTSSNLAFNGMSAGTNTTITGGGSNTAIQVNWVGSPMTTEGDIIYYHSSGATRLSIGAQNTVLTSNGTDPIYKSPVTRTSFNMGAVPTVNKHFTVTDANVSSSSLIVVSRAYNSDVDELDMDPMIFSAVPGTGNFTLNVSAINGPVIGTYYADYIIG